MADEANKHDESPDDEIDIMISLGDAGDLSRDGIRKQLNFQQPALLLYDQGGAKFRELFGLNSVADARYKLEANLNGATKIETYDELESCPASPFTAEEFEELGGARIASILDEALKKAR